MKYFYSLLKITSILFLFTLFSLNAYAQPCGIDANIHILGGTATCGYYADTSGYQAGWIGYKYEWKINDEAPFITSNTPAFLYDQLGAGFNRIQLTVYGTDPSSGDSCVDTYTNIFQATGNAVYPEFDVTVNGNTVNFSGTYKGGPYFASAINVSYDFGDGNISTANTLMDSHTYSNPGGKTVYMNISITDLNTGLTSYGTTSRSIQIGSGVTNVEFSNIMDNTICDSIQLYSYSAIPFTQGLIGQNFSVNSNPPVNGTYSNISTAEVPGHDFIMIEGSDPAISSDVNYHLIEINDCGIIPDTISGYVFDDLNYNGMREPGEPPIAYHMVYVSSVCAAQMNSTKMASYATFTDSSGYYSIIVPHYNVYVHLSFINGYILTFPQSPYYTVNFNSGTIHSGYNFGVTALSVSLCGRTYLDDNNDSIYSPADRGLNGVTLAATNTITNLVFHSYSSPLGTYCFELPPGNYVVKPVNFLLDSASFVPDSIIVNAGTGGSYNNNNFGFRSPVPVDFNLNLMGIWEARPGFDYPLSTRIRNTGYQKGKGQVVCSYDPILTPVSLNPVNGVINTVSNTVTWITDSIAPGTEIYYTANFNIPTTTALGTILNNTSSITALPGTVENDLSDNTSTRNQTVVGSYDPNDKTVTPAGIGATGDVLHNTELNYLIRFQNTGTASAINVFVADTIDDDLDLNTLVVHRASHNYDLVINENVLTWRFFNINLPDSNTNEPDSHGFIEYSVSPKDGLSDGTPIENTAYIYFDFNAPVVTNTTLNTMQSSLTAVEEIHSNQQLLVYPNPGNDKIILLPRGKVSGQISINLYDLTGKKIRSLYNGTYSSTPAIEADVCGLSNGVYILEMQYDGGVEKTKWVKH